MGNYSTLSNKTTTVFEAKYSMPFFWFLGFRNEDKENIITHTKDFFKAVREDIEFSPKLECIKIPSKSYIELLTYNTRYIEAAYPYLLNMYQDFILIIKMYFKDSQWVEISCFDVILMSDESEVLEYWIKLFNSFENSTAYEKFEDFNIIGNSIGSGGYETWIHDKYVTQFSLPEPIAIDREENIIQTFLKKIDLYEVSDIIFYIFLVCFMLFLYFRLKIPLNITGFTAFGMVILQIAIKLKIYDKKIKKSKKKIYYNFFISFLNKTNKSVDLNYLNKVLAISKIISPKAENLLVTSVKEIGNVEVFYQNHKKSLIKNYPYKSIYDLQKEPHKRIFSFLQFNNYLTINHLDDSYEQISESINIILKQIGLKKVTNTYILFKIFVSDDYYHIGIVKKMYKKQLSKLCEEIRLSVIFFS
ncbi:hypothetical protein [Vagococcus martis]